MKLTKEQKQFFEDLGKLDAMCLLCDELLTDKDKAQVYGFRVCQPCAENIIGISWSDVKDRCYKLAYARAEKLDRRSNNGQK